MLRWLRGVLYRFWPAELPHTWPKMEDDQPVESPAKQEYRKLMEAYRLKNPLKYELKREAMEKKLETL